MHHYERAVAMLPVSRLLQIVQSSHHGIAMSELIQSLQQEGIPDRVALTVILSVLDTGDIELDKNMKLVRSVEAAA